MAVVTEQGSVTSHLASVARGKKTHDKREAIAERDVRREMVAAALANEAGFDLEDCDLRRTGPSFAIETVRSF